jgi:multimeric flavodoxin WrbA
MTHVVAVNGSPNAEKGNTATLLNAFLDGIKEAGATVELFYPKKLAIKPCTGELHCWYEVPGECVIQDDMQTLYPRLREANILILATPVYIPLPGKMQMFLNRLCPLLAPELVTVKGRTRGRFYEDVKIKKIVLVATGGWWELGNFDTVVRIAEELAKDASIEFAGAILRPHASLMQHVSAKKEEILNAAKTAGIELVENGAFSPNVLQTISQPLIGQEKLRDQLNALYERVVRKESGKEED